MAKHLADAVMRWEQMPTIALFEDNSRTAPPSNCTREAAARDEGHTLDAARLRTRSWCPPLTEGPPDQYTWTPYADSAAVTGWKNVVPPVLQSPLPPEVRPTAAVLS
jgi:hypothetical protein